MTLQARDKQAPVSMLAWYGMAPAALSANPMMMPPRAQALQLKRNTGCPSLELPVQNSLTISSPLWAYTWEAWDAPRHVG